MTDARGGVREESLDMAARSSGEVEQLQSAIRYSNCFRSGAPHINVNPSSSSPDHSNLRNLPIRAERRLEAPC